MIIKIFTGPANYNIKKLYKQTDNEYIIGVDNGSIMLLNENIDMNMAIGDFDSITDSEKNRLKDNVSNIIEFKSEKDYTDTYLAVKEALKLNPDGIIIYGGLGKRIDHTYANIGLLKLGNITICNDTTSMYILDPGFYEIQNDYDYISFFAIEEVEGLNIKNFKYEMTDYLLEVDDPLCVSNSGSGSVSFKSGSLLVILEKE